MPSLQDEVESLSRGEITEIADRLVKTSAEQRRAKRLEKTAAGGFSEGIQNFIKTNPGLLSGALAGGIGGGALGGIFTQPDEQGKYRRTRNILGGALAGAGLGAGLGYGWKRLGQLAGPASTSHGASNLNDINQLPGDLVEKGRAQFANIKHGLDPVTGAPRTATILERVFGQDPNNYWDKFRHEYPMLGAMIYGDVGLHTVGTAAGAIRQGANQIPSGNIHDLIRGANKIVAEGKDGANLSAESKSLYELAKRIIGLGDVDREALQKAVAQARGGWQPTTGTNAITAQTARPISGPLVDNPVKGRPAFEVSPAQMGAISAKGRSSIPMAGVSELADTWAWLKSLIPGLKPANRLRGSGYRLGPGGLGVQEVPGRWGSALRGLSSLDLSKPRSPLLRLGGRGALYAGAPLLLGLGGEYFGAKLDDVSRAKVLQKLIDESAARK